MTLYLEAMFHSLFVFEFIMQLVNPTDIAKSIDLSQNPLTAIIQELDRFSVTIGPSKA